MDKLHQNISVVNVVKQGITLDEVDYSLDVIDDSIKKQQVTGIRNSYLEYVSQVVNKSPIGAACLQVRKNFIAGAGLSTLEHLKVNENETLLELHKKLSADLAFSHRFCVLVCSVLSGTMPKVKTAVHLPIEWVRYSIPDKDNNVATIKYNPYYNTSEEMAHCFDEYLIFENLETTKKRLITNIANGEKNEIYEAYFFVETSEINRVYSKPPYFESGENAFLADANAWVFHKRNIENNFFLGGILQVQGRPDLEIEDKNGNKTTLEQTINEKLRNMFAGGNSAGSIMTLFKNNTEESDISYKPIESNSNDTKLLDIMQLVRQYIPTIMSVSPLLGGIEITGKLGDSKEKEGAIKFQNDKSKDFHNYLNKFYGAFYGADVKVVKIQESIEVPVYIWNSLTIEQQQKYISKNYPDLL